MFVGGFRERPALSRLVLRRPAMRDRLPRFVPGERPASAGWWSADIAQSMITMRDVGRPPAG